MRYDLHVGRSIYRTSILLWIFDVPVVNGWLLACIENARIVLAPTVAFWQTTFGCSLLFPPAGTELISHRVQLIAGKAGLGKPLKGNGHTRNCSNPGIEKFTESLSNCSFQPLLSGWCFCRNGADGKRQSELKGQTVVDTCQMGPGQSKQKATWNYVDSLFLCMHIIKDTDVHLAYSKNAGCVAKQKCTGIVLAHAINRNQFVYKTFCH